MEDLGDHRCVPSARHDPRAQGRLGRPDERIGYHAGTTSCGAAENNQIPGNVMPYRARAGTKLSSLRLCPARVSGSGSRQCPVQRLFRASCRRYRGPTLALYLVPERTTVILMSGDTSQWHELEGRIVPRHFLVGYIVLSYIVSYVGTWTTLELFNLRTAGRGLYNWFVGLEFNATLFEY